MTTAVAPKQLNPRTLADLYEETLKVRNACANRLRAIDQGRDEPPAEAIVASSPLLDRLEDALEVAREEMERVLPEHPLYEWLMGVPGVNRTVGCRVLGLIPMESEEDFATFSRLRVFAGICPGRNRLVKGQKACFSRRLKTVLFVAFASMLKSAAVCRGKANAPVKFYDDIYFKWRWTYAQRCGVAEKGAERLYNTGKWIRGEPGVQIQTGEGGTWQWQKRTKCTSCGETTWVGSLSTARCKHKGCSSEVVNNDDWQEGIIIGADLGMWRFKISRPKGSPREEWPDLRQHFMAKNKLLDVFLCHVWRQWREAMGWSVRSLYVHEKLGHHMDYQAEDFSSPAMAEKKIKQHK